MENWTDPILPSWKQRYHLAGLICLHGMPIIRPSFLHGGKHLPTSHLVRVAMSEFFNRTQFVSNLFGLKLSSQP